MFSKNKSSFEKIMSDVIIGHQTFQVFSSFGRYASFFCEFDYPNFVILTEPVRIKCALEQILPTNKQILGLSALDVDGFRQNDKAWD